MGSIAVVGLGVEGELAPGPLTLGRLRAADVVVVASPDGLAAGVLGDVDIQVTPLPELGVPIDAPGDEVISALLSLAETRDVAYVTVGFPFLKGGVVSGLLARCRRGVEVFPVTSPVQVALLAIDSDMTADLDIVDAAAVGTASIERGSHIVVTDVRNRMLARRTADVLTRVFPSDQSVVLARRVGPGGFSMSMLTLAALAEAEVAEETAVYIPPYHLTPPGGFGELVRVIGVLRSPDGCPWDRAQDHRSLRHNTIEEAYETVAAIDAGDLTHLAEELGDLLLQIVLHAQIASESGAFTIDDVVAGVTTKLRRRHPHIFGDAVAETPEDVSARWDAIKRDEKAGSGALDGLAASLPSLMYAQKMSRRAVAVGFEWETLDDVWTKVHEEIEELKATEPGSERAADEIGDLLFTIVNVARKQGIDAETALRGTCEKFRRRFGEMEAAASAEGGSLSELDIAAMERLWQAAKRAESQSGQGKGNDPS